MLRKKAFKIGVILAVFTACFITVNAFDQGNVIESVIGLLGLSSGEISSEGSTENNFGQVKQIYSDDEYTYYIDESNGTVTSITLNDEEMNTLGVEFDSGNADIISTEQADNLLYDVIENLFPEYNISNLTVTADYETGSYLDYFRYYIEEISDDTRLNIASISLAFNGKVTSVSGSHNTPDMFVITTDAATPALQSEDVSEIAFEYLIDHKAEIEQAMWPSAEIQPQSEDSTLTAEDVILPDGMNHEDYSFTEQLPDFELMLESAEDLHNQEMIKVMYHGNVTWELACSIESNWSEYDSILDPSIMIYIDAASGDVVDCYTTDGE